MKNKFQSLLALTLVLALPSCTAADFRKEVGIQKDAPDEFLVMPRNKLAIPDTAVSLPAPTKRSKGSVAASESGREVVYGVTKTTEDRPNSAGENALLAKAGADKADPSIRKTVNKERKEKTGVFGTKRGGTLESILDPFGYNDPKEPVVDAKKENERIKSDIAAGKKIDPDAVVKTDPKKAPFEQDKDTDGQ